MTVLSKTTNRTWRGFDHFRVGELQAHYRGGALAKTAAGKRRAMHLCGGKTDNNATIIKAFQEKVLRPLIDSRASEAVQEDWVDDWKPENARKIANPGTNAAGPNFDSILASNDSTAGGHAEATLERLPAAPADWAGAYFFVAFSTMTPLFPSSATMMS